MWPANPFFFLFFMNFVIFEYDFMSELLCFKLWETSKTNNQMFMPFTHVHTILVFLLHFWWTSPCPKVCKPKTSLISFNQTPSAFPKLSPFLFFTESKNDLWTEIIMLLGNGFMCDMKLYLWKGRKVFG